MREIPRRFSATGAEAAISITRSVTHHRLGVGLTFRDMRLDAARLARAVRLSLDAEPVLGCAFRTEGRHASWERLGDLDATVPFSVADTYDPATRLTEFQATEVPDDGPQAGVALFRAADGDTLGVKISHVAGDGRAAKQYVYLLADIFTRLASDPDYAPQPNLAPRPSGTDVWANLSPQQRRDAKRAKSWAQPTWVVPSKGTSGDSLTYRSITIAPERFQALCGYGRDRGATVNDLLLTSTFRACFAAFDPPTGRPLSLMCTADLRRFVRDPDALPVCNLSISAPIELDRVPDESFDDTLARVMAATDAWAKTSYGAGPAASAEKLARLGYPVTKALLSATLALTKNSKKTYPWLTNLGVLDDRRLRFDGIAPDEAYTFGPAAIGASIVPVISTYRDALTVSMGYCASDCEPAIVDGVLNRIEGELVGSARVPAG